MEKCGGILLPPGSIIQVNPDIPYHTFAGCLMIVEEVHPWGVTAYMQMPGEERGVAYGRIGWDFFEPTIPFAFAPWRQEEMKREGEKDGTDA